MGEGSGMKLRGIRSRFRPIGIASCVLLILGLTFSSSAGAEQVGCSFRAPATVGVADLIDIPPNPDAVPPEVPPAEFLTELATAGCTDQFSCSGCQITIDFGFVGTGVIAGEVRIIGFNFSAGQYVEVARATCGPSIGTPVSGGCFGTLTTTPASSFHPGLLLDCRAHGVVAVIVFGTCQGFTS